MTYPSPYPTLHLPQTDIYSLLFSGLTDEEAALPAITELGTEQTITYGELRDAADAIAGELARRGISRGSTVSLQIPNSINFVAAFLGILRAGATVSPMGVLMNQSDVVKLVRMSESDLYIGISDVEEIPQIFDTHLGSIIRAGAPAPEIEIPADSVACLPFSSGTTGLPKGVELTHFNLASNVRQCSAMVDRLDLGENVRTFSPLPFSHIYGITVLMLMPLLRRSQVFTLAKFDLQLFLGAFPQHQIKLAFIAPPMAIAMAKHPAIEPAWFASTEVLISSAAPLDREVSIAVSERLNTKVVQGWGMTEASPLVAVSDGTVDPGSVGKPAPNTEIRLVDIETFEDVAQGETGEVIVRGPQVMRGYFSNEEATRESLVDGWLRTGDFARLGEDGEIYIVDRAKEVIKYKGYQVAPAELEAVLLTHPDIADAGVVGVDREGLEIPRAFVVKREGAELGKRDVMDYVAERVTPYKKVRAVTFIEEIPKNPTGKILRKDLRQIPFEG